MPHAACRLAHLSRHYAQLGVELVGCLSISGSCAFIVSHVPCCGYLNVCFLCLLHFNFAVSPFLFRLFFALSSAKHCRRAFPFSDTLRSFSSSCSFSIWHCRYGPFIMILLISLFRLKTTLGKFCKFRMRRQNTLQDTSPRQSTPAEQVQQGFSVSRQSPLERVSVLGMLKWRNGGMGASLAWAKYSNETRHCQHFIVSSRSTWRGS